MDPGRSPVYDGPPEGEVVTALEMVNVARKLKNDLEGRGVRVKHFKATPEQFLAIRTEITIRRGFQPDDFDPDRALIVFGIPVKCPAIPL